MNRAVLRTRIFALLCLVCCTTSRSATITVTTTADTVSLDSAASLREALLSLDAGADLNADVTAHRSGSYGTSDQISFSIGSGAKTIVATSPLPLVRRPMVIDGSTQPGFAGTPLITLLGTNAGTATDGLVVVSSSGATLSNLIVQQFGGRGVVVLGYFIFSNGFEADSALEPPIAPEAADTAATFTHVVATGNGHEGFAVYGAMSATLVESKSNSGAGMLVDSAQPANIVNSKIHNNAQAGIRVLRTGDHPLILGFPGSWPGAGLNVTNNSLVDPSSVQDNGGNGIELGDAAAQGGFVYAAVNGTVVSGNETGIWVREKDRVKVRTYAAIHNNNIYANRSVGLHVEQSYFLRANATSILTYTGNQIHNNARAPTADCSGVQSAPQVWFEDPPPYPCFDDSCTYPVINFGVPTDPACAAVAFGGGYEAECGALNNPQTSPDHTEHSCVWNPTTFECRHGYPFHGVCGTTSPNLLWGYEGSGLNFPNSVGAFISNDAAVSADDSNWQFGGSANKDWVTDGYYDSVIHVTVCGGAPTSCP